MNLCLLYQQYRHNTTGRPTSTSTITGTRPRRRRSRTTNAAFLLSMTLLLRWTILCKSLNPHSSGTRTTGRHMRRTTLVSRSLSSGSQLLGPAFSRRTPTPTIAAAAAAAGGGSRLAASTASEALSVQDDDDEVADPLIHPSDLFRGSIPYPVSLSPSSILEFQKCPQSFLFQYIYKMRQPTSTALAKGSMCHSALEQVFDLTPEQRTLENLQNLFRRNWSQNRLSDTYRALFEVTDDTDTDVTDAVRRDLEAEGVWGRTGLALLENYYRLEDPKKVTRPNPVQREIWVKANLAVDSTAGATGYTTVSSTDSNESSNSKKGSPPSFLVRGIVDRLDLVQAPDDKRDVALRVVDYKTGKAPNLKYSAAMNQKIADESFFQLKIYALLIREKGAAAALEKTTMDLRWLRLFYLTSESGEAAFMDMDLGATPQERDRLLQEVHAELAAVWNKVLELVALQDPTKFVGCDRSFCYCHKCRPRFVPGTVWEPPE